MDFSAIVFLDVDGVLNSERWFRSPEYKEKRQSFKDLISRTAQDEQTDDAARIMLKTTHIDPVCLDKLNILLTKHNLGIVVSSTWRIADFTLAALGDCGIDNWKDRFRGVTRRSRCGEVRGNEIQDWLTDHAYTGKYIILDDDSDMAHLAPNLVHTSWALGLTDKDLARAEELLT